MAIMLLKTIGIILLGLLILLLLSVLLLLFAPIRLRFKGLFKGEPKAELSLSWIFGLVKLNGSLSNGDVVYDFTYPLMTLINKIKNKNNNNKRNKAVKDSAKKTDPARSASSSPSSDKPKGSSHTELPHEKNTPRETYFEETEADGKIYEEKEEPVPNIVVRIFNRFRLVEDKKDIMSCGFKNIKYLLKSIQFKTLDINIYFGFEDPSLTGEILGFLYALGIPLHKGIVVKADFDKAVFKGNAKADGRTDLLHIIIPVVRILLNKNIRALLFQGGKK